MTERDLRLTLLGTGSSGGVPRLGPDWGACDPSEPRNRRSRCSAFLERVGADGQRTQVLIDTSPDFREQALRAGISRLDAVFFTHDHADQCHGIDDLRMISMRMKRRVPVFMDGVSGAVLKRRFGYCFHGFEEGGYPAILDDAGLIEHGVVLDVEGPGGAVNLTPIALDHGAVTSFGFRCGPIAYCNDVVNIPERSFEVLEGVGVLIVDALRYMPHPTHSHVEKSLQWIGRVKPELAVLTNLHIDLDYQTLEAELPESVRVGFDGAEINHDGEKWQLRTRSQTSQVETAHNVDYANQC